MKRRSASPLILVTILLGVTLTAQSQTSADRAILQAWDDAARQSPSLIEDGRLVLSEEERDTYCAYMRTYRVKREISGSDVTRPAGYTTCVPAARFSMKSSVVRSQDAEPKEKAPLR